MPYFVRVFYNIHAQATVCTIHYTPPQEQHKERRSGRLGDEQADRVQHQERLTETGHHHPSWRYVVVIVVVVCFFFFFIIIIIIVIIIIVLSIFIIQHMTYRKTLT